MNQELIDKVRAMLKGASMLWSYWGEALTHAATMKSSTISSCIKDTTPLESLYETLLNNSKMRVFGCAAYFHKGEELRQSKLDDQAHIQVYPKTKIGLYHAHLLNSERVINPKHVLVDREKLAMKAGQKHFFSASE